MSNLLEFRLRRTADDQVEPGLFDLEYVDAANRFARHATAWIDDDSRDAWDDYPRGTGVEIEISPPGSETFGREFAGFVMEREDRDHNGADVLELTIYSFDHFLRRQQVNRDFSGETITNALEEIVVDFTPVAWEPANVDVVNDDTLSRGFEGEKVDNAIAELASKSAGEVFGVTDDLEFYFRPGEGGTAPRGIDNSQWLDYDFPEHNARGVNELQLFYGTGGDTGSLVVRDGGDQQELQDRTGADGPVRFREEVTREDITNAADARDKAQELLDEREPVLSGTITTFGLFGAEPGDVLPVEIVPRDIDADFRIAELRYRLGDDATDVTVLEKRGEGQAEQLVRMSDTLDRVEQRAADRGAPTTTFEGPLATPTRVRCTARIGWRMVEGSTFQPGANRSEPGVNRSPGPGWQGTARVVESSTCRVTTAYLDDLRDVWREDVDSITIDEIGAGIGTSAPSRTDSALEEETDRHAIADTFRYGSETVRFGATIPEPDVLVEVLDGESQVVDVEDYDTVWAEIEGAGGADGEDGVAGNYSSSYGSNYGEGDDVVGKGGEGGLGAVCQGLVDVSDVDSIGVSAASGDDAVFGGEEGEEGEGDAGDGGTGAGASGLGFEGIWLEAGGGGGGGGGAGTDGNEGGAGGAGGGGIDNGGAGGAGGTTGSPDGADGGDGEPIYDEDRTTLFVGESGASDGDGLVRIYSQPPIQELGLFDGTEDSLKSRAVFDHGTEIQGILDRDVDVQLQLTLLPNPASTSTPTIRGLEVHRDATAGDDVSAETPSQIEFGSGDDDPSPSDTALDDPFQTEPIDEFRRRGSGVVDATATTANQTGSAVTLREWGVLNDADELLSRLTFADLILEDGDELTARQRKRFENR